LNVYQLSLSDKHGFVVQIVVQQIHNKSQQCSLGDTQTGSPGGSSVARAKSDLYDQSCCACSDKEQLESRDEVGGADYQYSVDGYYTTRRTSLMDTCTPFIHTTADDTHNVADFTTATTPRAAPPPPPPHGCIVVDKYGSAATPASRLCHHATPTPVTSCADCQSEYERRRVVNATAAAPTSSVDVAMTTKDKARRHHVYELPHVI